MYYHGTTIESFHEIMRSGGWLNREVNYFTSRIDIAIINSKSPSPVIVEVIPPSEFEFDPEYNPKWDAFYTPLPIKVVRVVHCAP